MKRLFHALACVMLGVSGAGEAQNGLPDGQAASTPTRMVQLSKVIFDPEISKVDQHVRAGTICIMSGRPLDFGSERTADYERFERLFSTAMNEQHFNVLAKSSNLFEGEGSDAKADFLIGATFRPRSVDICDSVSGQKGTIAISVEWQIYDRRKQQIVETITTEGSGLVPKFQRDGIRAMIDHAFSASLAALINRGILQKHLGEPAS